ncbi:hypothetical protein P1X15_29570 [Runella sp. MFBS21]|uniref:hypothetical protein n=1 Tax=Runella sp. MFBS21 TaxID=3034018 RepID=UPI0023F947D1|nr:hypothetical protein [Runella sp. MFBS21]MDF7821803.1 hypothetical protein [Runella sp. MFBS21]
METVINQTHQVQAALDNMAQSIYEEAKQNKEPLYMSSQGHAVEVWPHTEKVYILLTEKVAQKLGIDYKTLISEVLE